MHVLQQKIDMAANPPPKANESILNISVVKSTMVIAEYKAHWLLLNFNKRKPRKGGTHNDHYWIYAISNETCPSTNYSPCFQSNVYRCLHRYCAPYHLTEGNAITKGFFIKPLLFCHGQLVDVNYHRCTRYIPIVKMI